MSLKTRSNGFTAWANLRLQAVGHDIVKNILMDIMKGYNLKILIESVTGKNFRKLKTFDGLTLTQKETRIQWIMDELILCEIVAKDAEVDTRAVALRISPAVFTMLWHIVCYDIHFIWLRSEFLQGNEDERLIIYPLSCIPSMPVGHSQDINLISQLTTKGVSEKLSSKESVMRRDARMISNTKLNKTKPSPVSCILEIVNSHLDMTRDGRKLKKVSNFKELVDCRVLCSLVNSLVPDTFTSEILLNDRWTVNLALQTMAVMSKCSSPFYAEDLVEADTRAVCSYFTFFFLSGYKLRQSMAAIRRSDFLTLSSLKNQEKLSKLGDSVNNQEDLIEKKSCEDLITQSKAELAIILANYDIDNCRAWLRDVHDAQKQTWSIISVAMKKKYETIEVPISFTINELVHHMMINLSLTTAFGFYEAKSKENLTHERNIVVFNKLTGLYHDDQKLHDGKKRRTARKILGISKLASCELVPSNYTDYIIYLESSSSNKHLKAGTLFLYQIFPNDLSDSKKLLFKAIKIGELHTVQKLVSFFRSDPTFINDGIGNSNNGALHIACKCGSFDIALYLLEQNADVNKQNGYGNTPLFFAADSGCKNTCKLLIEYGANIYLRNRASETVLDYLRQGELRQYLENIYNYWKQVLPDIINGKFDALKSTLQKHKGGKQTLSTLRSRCINGSTLLHVASYYSALDSIKVLLSLGLDVNIRDHKNATALHRARSAEIIEFLLEHNADLYLTDFDNNSALHARCYGEQGKETNVDCIKSLVQKGVDVCNRNEKGLMAIHCAAIQGRIDALEILIGLDKENMIIDALNKENEHIPPSLVYLALANEHLDCARWLVQHDYHMKSRESDRLVEKILMDQKQYNDGASIVTFLYENGASSNAIYPGENSALHLAASRCEMLDVLKICIDNGCDVNQRNHDQYTPLFYTVISKNYRGAALLIKNGAEITSPNVNGTCAFDLIQDHDVWVSSELFDEKTVETLKAFSMKQTRQLVRSITQKVQNAENAMRYADGVSTLEKKYI